MVGDADKIVEKVKKERPGLYQSSQHPRHFENEGEEYSHPGASEEASPENAGYDSAHGISKGIKGQRQPADSKESSEAGTRKKLYSEESEMDLPAAE